MYTLQSLTCSRLMSVLVLSTCTAPLLAPSLYLHRPFTCAAPLALAPSHRPPCCPSSSSHRHLCPSPPPPLPPSCSNSLRGASVAPQLAGVSSRRSAWEAPPARRRPVELPPLLLLTLTLPPAWSVPKAIKEEARLAVRQCATCTVLRHVVMKWLWSGKEGIWDMRA